MKDLSELFKALSDETRLQMLTLLLRRGELCVCDFVESMGITQSKASRHLRYLANAGLAVDRRDTVWVFYRVPGAPSPEAAALLDALGPILASRDLGRVEARLDEWQAAKTTPAACRRKAPGRSRAH